MIPRRIMLIGEEGSGKRMLANYFNNTKGETAKIPDITFGDKTIVIPGGFLENPRMYKHIISIAQNYASHLLVVVGSENCTDTGAPGLTRTFECPVLGVITGDDLEKDHKKKALFFMEKLGIDPPFFFINRESGKGFAELQSTLCCAN